jgi:hypothetical protein
MSRRKIKNPAHAAEKRYGFARSEFSKAKWEKFCIELARVKRYLRGVKLEMLGPDKQDPKWNENADAFKVVANKERAKLQRYGRSLMRGRVVGDVTADAPDGVGEADNG